MRNKHTLLILLVPRDLLYDTDEVERMALRATGVPEAKLLVCFAKVVSQCKLENASATYYNFNGN